MGGLDWWRRRLTDTKHLFIVFENRKNRNALTQETMRHRFAFAQAKNPNARMLRVAMNTKIPVGHGLTVTSDKPAFLAVDIKKGTFREHKGKLSNLELDKFVRQVENGKLNVVRKLQP